MFPKHTYHKHSLSTLQTQPSLFLDPDLFRSTIHTLISQIRPKYNGPQLKQLLVNITRLQQYNMYKLARCNRQLQRQASFSFKLTEIENLLERYNMSFLKVLEDSPDYRLDDLYRRFVHINHKVGELDPEHMKVFGGNIGESVGEPGRKVMREKERMREKVERGSQENGRLMKVVEEMREENQELRKEIERAKIETREVIDELMRFKEVEREYEDRIYHLEGSIRDLQRKLDGKDEMLRQKDELVENYKNSIQKLKFSLLTPIKLTKPASKQSDKFIHSAETATNKPFYNTSRYNNFSNNKEYQQERERQSPGFRSEKGSCTPKSKKTPPKPPSSTKLIKQKSSKNKVKYEGDLPDLWNMLLVQCVSLQEMINAGDEQQ